jgi:hypothetical protein
VAGSVEPSNPLREPVFPYSVYYPLLLVGFLSAVVPLGVLPAIRRRYQELELRTMRAHDLGR